MKPTSALASPFWHSSHLINLAVNSLIPVYLIHTGQLPDVQSLVFHSDVADSMSRFVNFARSCLCDLLNLLHNATFPALHLQQSLESHTIQPPAFQQPDHLCKTRHPRSSSAYHASSRPTRHIYPESWVTARVLTCICGSADFSGRGNPSSTLPVSILLKTPVPIWSLPMNQPQASEPQNTGFQNDNSLIPTRPSGRTSLLPSSTSKRDDTHTRITAQREGGEGDGDWREHGFPPSVLPTQYSHLPAASSNPPILKRNHVPAQSRTQHTLRHPSSWNQSNRSDS
ncbi:hypothetical protein CH63R_12190 [Colletotrichum higginsianum IMI 349063]|uniref:Uncharacterized protein n=1 Tax=Colletotrichum higginsianum (strain IMI 349063) TaxID=759273 RepID=A0A1B7Y0D9_COLHI|nr:hypothetical protein CH63R_12190 [Colletotrichum higginsianum IMI 349063]OBR05487.1 hypothetical protein CH63R_12190 [Colletotrichum higginsianum IMI 349063]